MVNVVYGSFPSNGEVVCSSSNNNASNGIARFSLNLMGQELEY